MSNEDQNPSEETDELVESEKQTLQEAQSLVARMALWVVGFYQRAISPLFPPTCRFTPSCSEYTRQAIQKYGFLKGVYLGTKRIFKCHPFHPGGYDPLE